MKYFLQCYMFLLFFGISLNSMELGDKLRLNGYANFYTISTNDEIKDNNENDFDTSGGVQARYQISNNLSVTAQIYFYEDEETTNNDSFDVDAKWLYLDYYLGDDITLRAGLFQFPIFTSSETGTIGYSTTFTETPLTSYGANGYEDFTGAEVLKKYFYDDFEFLLQLSYGSSENDLPTRGDGGSINGKTDSLKGITLKTSYEDLQFNIGYLQATTQLDEDNSEVDFSTYAFEADVNINDYIIKAGYIDVKLSQKFPDELRQYISLEYSFDDITPYIYYSNEDLSFEKISNMAPPGQSSLQNTITEKNSIGIRYDFNTNIAFKISYTNQINTRVFENSEDAEDYDIVKAMVNVIF